ncbi:MAG: tetratricopeptide repeat protein, partial [Candidatus Heimdallarchaeota archaeon]|nr:tetratricopeptide repeat protein [Candidatus Heimdallarchaeota archaeon]
TFGTVQLFSGELTVAHDALKKSLRISSRLSDDFRISASTANLANLMNYQGQLDKSQELFMQALQIAKKVNNRSSQAVILTNLAIGYYQGGDIKKAIEFMLESIKIAKTVGNHVRVIESMPYLLEFQLEIGDRAGAKSTVDEINEIRQNYPELDHFLVYSRALFLKYSHRLRDKIQAAALFENYLGGGNKTFEHEMNAHLHLCELIFDELVLYSHIDVKNEINDHLNKDYQISQKNHLFSEMIRILILRAKMMLLDFEFEKAHNTFEQAVIYAEETGIEYLKIKAQQEQELLQRNLDEWEEMVRRGSSIRNRAEKAKIKDYIDQVIKGKVP